MVGASEDELTSRHCLSIAGWDDRHVCAFVWSDDGNIGHHRRRGDDQMSTLGPEDRGGRCDSDPFAVRRFTSRTLERHLIARSGIEPIDRSWPHAEA